MEFIHYESQISERENNFVPNKNQKRRKNYNYSSSDEICSPVKQRNQANARERDRTHSVFLTPDISNLATSSRSASQNISVNSAFSTLRTLIPTEPRDRKLSKIETLRLASSYISHLGTQLLAGPVDQPCLRISGQFLDGDVTNSGRHQVCTFCIAHKKATKSIPMEQYVCPVSLNEQTYYNNLSPITSASIIANTDINSIYFQ